MKFILTRTSNDDKKEIEINSIEELMTLVSEEGKVIVMDYSEPTIEIYDYYRE